MDKPNSILPMVYDRISSKELLNSQIIASLLDIIKANQRKQSSIDEKYNIFYALRIWQKEVTLHSRILTDMLRVDGYHGLKAEPLKAFVDMLPENYKFQCDEKVEVTDEKGAGDMRRVDIFLKDANGQVIIIENKIYAGDQDKQLMDYHKFGKEQSAKNKKPIVLYLTLGGAQPSSASCGDLKDNEDYFCISYRDLIHNWIEGCIEMAEKSEKVALREVLHQYNQVIEYLVKKDMKNVNEILEKITNQEDYEALNELAATVGSIQATVQSVF